MSENIYTPNCIRTFTGQYVNVFDPHPDTLKIEDIAHALSQQCRFGGHLPTFYSVAQHSIYACHLASGPNKLEALMHDASEAFLLDIPSPIKKGLANYGEIEDKLMLALAAKFGFTWPVKEEIKNIDKELLVMEWNQLMLKQGKKIVCFSRAKSKRLFLEAFYQLTPSK